MQLAVGIHSGALIVAVGCVLAIIAVRNVAWAISTATVSGGVFSVTVEYGLWSVCITSASSSICQSINDPPDKHQATRGFATAGMASLLMSAACLCIYMFLYYKDHNRFKSTATLIAAIVFACLAAVLNTIANIIFGVHIEEEGFFNDGSNIYYCFYLLIVSGVLGIIGSVVAYVKRPIPIEPLTPTTTTTTVIHNRSYVSTITAPNQTIAMKTAAGHQPQPYGGYSYPQPPPYSQNPAGYPAPSPLAPPYPAAVSYSGSTGTGDPAFPPNGASKPYPPPQAFAPFPNTGTSNAAYPPSNQSTASQALPPEPSTYQPPPSKI